MAEHSMDLVIFGIVVALRIVVPLFIPKFPLPAMILAMIIDAADQTIFQSFTNLDLTNYQSYDKALDVYYLAIAYLSTMRNWQHQVAFDTSRFLWYYRLVGVALFEIFHVRALLLIFPNTFEYFFDFYQGVRTRWNPLRMSKRVVIGAAAFIWIVIKLPQEYWIHVAQLDTTDLVKEDLFGVPVDTGFGEIIRDNPLFFVALVCFLAALVIGLRYLIQQKLPPKDWNLTFRDHPSDVSVEALNQQVRSMRGKVFTSELLEKTVLLTLIMTIFVRIVPGTPSSPWEQMVMIALLLILNILVSEAVVRVMGWSDQAVAGSFVGTMAVNTVIVALARQLLPGDRSFHWTAALFFVFMISVMLTFYDRYRPIYLARFGDDRLEKRIADQLGVSR
ncbi:MAG: hypothetical protein KF883_02650 [Thermomicrobiales bacterium]|nr:hypothetical protein [Thermomicrobiales bacterium]